MLNDNDFDLNNQISISTIQDEPERVEAEIVSSPEQFEEMSLTVQKKNKEALANMKKKVMYSLDKRKLNEAQKIFSSLENIGDIFSDQEVMKKVRANVSTAQDLKFLSDTYSKLIESNQKLMRIDSVDAQGSARKFNIGIQYEDEQGSKLQTVISVGD